MGEIEDLLSNKVEFLGFQLLSLRIISWNNRDCYQYIYGNIKC